MELAGWYFGVRRKVTGRAHSRWAGTRSESLGLGHLPRELLIISERRLHRIIGTYGSLEMDSGVKNFASAL